MVLGEGVGRGGGGGVGDKVALVEGTWVGVVKGGERSANRCMHLLACPSEGGSSARVVRCEGHDWVGCHASRA